MLASGFLLQDVLRLSDFNTIGWAAFDSEWYLATYPSVRPNVDESCPTAILQFYIEEGQALGHSPNIFFDEAWHLRRYPRVAEAVLNGRVASAFERFVAAFVDVGALASAPRADVLRAWGK